MASAYFRIGPSFWVDERVPRADDTRLLGLYLLTSPHRTSEGLFRMPLQYAMTDLGWGTARFARAFEKLTQAGFVEYDGDSSVCLLVNALKWQQPENPNQVKAAVKALEKLPATPLATRFGTLAATYCPRLAQALPEPFRNGFAQPSRNGLGEPIGNPPTPTPPHTPPLPPPPGGNRTRDWERWRSTALTWAKTAGVEGPSRSIGKAIEQAKPWETDAPEDHFRSFVASYFGDTLEVVG